MPQRIHCNRCNSVLYEGTEFKSPFEIIGIFNGKCPKCDRKLSPDPIRVDIRPIE